MTSALKLKRTYTPSRTFTLGELSEGEIGINVTDKKIYIRDDNNTIVQLNSTTGAEPTTLTGEVTGNGTGTIATTVTNAAVLGKVLTGFTSGAGTLASTDTLLQAIQKLDGNIGTKGTVSTVSVVTANGISGTVATATTTPAITLSLGAITPVSVSASGTVTGSNLSGTNTGDQTITLTGQATGSGTGSFAVTLDNAAVIGKVLTGFVSAAGTVAATDNILQAIQKLDGNIAALTLGLNYKGVWNANTNSPTLASGVGTKNDYYKVSTAGNTTIDGNNNWTAGDLIIYNGTAWDKVEGGSPDVISVAGRVGAITLTTSDIGGLGTIATQNANNVTITGGSITGTSFTGNISGNATNVTGIVAVANGGSGVATLTGYLKGNGTSAFTGSSTIPVGDITGLGTMATQNASSVSITGGTLDGVTIDCGTYT